VNDITKYVAKWKLNPHAPWPKDPKEYQKIIEDLWAGAGMLMKKGLLVDWGAFINTNQGYCVFEGDPATCMKGVMMFYPWVLMEPRTVLSLEETSKNTREMWEMRAKI
jgi:hypothetical protein